MPGPPLAGGVPLITRREKDRSRAASEISGYAEAIPHQYRNARTGSFRCKIKDRQI